MPVIEPVDAAARSEYNTCLSMEDGGRKSSRMMEQQTFDSFLS
jgi:hypothetical protein